LALALALVWGVASPLSLAAWERSGRSVCAPLVLEVGVRLSVDVWRPRYVRAKNLK
jgi:hypothetical protein